MTDDEPREVNLCRQCGAEYSERTSPLGLCPACLLKLGLSDPAWTPPSTPAPKGDEQPVPREEPVRSDPAPPTARHLRLPSRRWWAAAAVTLVVMAAAFVIWRHGDSNGPPGNTIRFSLPLPDDTDILDGAQFAVSPDGTQVVVAAHGPEGRQRLWLRALQSTEWRELGQTDEAAFPFWSPDSRQIGFFAGRSLKRIDIANGLAYTLCDAPEGRGGTWSPDGVIVFAAHSTGPLLRVPATGGTPQQVTHLERHELAHLWPHALPGVDRLVFLADGLGRSGPDSPEGTYLVSMRTGEQRLLVPGGGSAAYARGFLIFARGSSLIAQPFDQDRAELTGDVQIMRGAEQLGGQAATGSAFSVSSDVLVYRSGRPASSWLQWFDREGRTLDALGEPADYRHVSLSPDGRRVAAARGDARDSSSNIWLLDPGRGTTSRVTIGPSEDSSPVWSPDGARIAFTSTQRSSPGVYVTSAGGGGREDLLLESPEPTRVTDWSRDGRLLLYSAISPKSRSDLWMLPLMGDPKPAIVVQTPFSESDGRFSPDGRWVAYVSDESGRDEVYVRAFPPSDGRWQISAGGGTLPRWRDDGRELFFVSTDGQLRAVGVEAAGDGLRTGTPLALFPIRGVTDYETSATGRLLMKLPVRKRGDNELQVVLNWAAELRR